LAEYLEIEKKSLEAIMSSFKTLPEIFNAGLVRCLLPQEMKNRAEKIFTKRYKQIFGQLSVTGNN
ncbi:MAG TPA: hypothetical protein VJC18_08895, partial [bacterium]|nr:hypothetical protein [bacterium]